MSETITIQAPADGIELTATINLTGFGYHRDDDGDEIAPRTVMDCIITEAAGQLLRRFTEDRDARRSLVERITTIRDEEIRARIAPLIDEAFDRNISVTNQYGEPTGRTMTLTEMIMDLVKSESSVKERSTGYGNRDTIMSKLVKEEINHALQRELKATLDKAKAQVTAAVQAKGAEVLAETITRMAGVSR